VTGLLKFTTSKIPVLKTKITKLTVAVLVEPNVLQVTQFKSLLEGQWSNANGKINFRVECKVKEA
jgi:hypothetical protein